MRRVIPLLLLLGCKKEQVPASVDASSADAAPDVVAIVPFDAGKPVAIDTPPVIDGYPGNVSTGMNDYADRIGFTADAKTHVYCWARPGPDSETDCELLDREGKVTHLSARRGDKAANAKLDKFLDDNKIATVDRKDPSHVFGPAVTGKWVDKDVTLAVKAEGPHVRVGGSVKGEAPVYPVDLFAKDSPKEYKDPFSVMNGISLTPDGVAIGFVAHVFACEFCDFFVHRQMYSVDLVGQIYNETGLRHHKAHDEETARVYFDRAATFGVKFASYNLACAMAPLASVSGWDKTATLEKAIEDDPTVRERAKKDPDFAPFRSESWYLDALAWDGGAR